MSEYYKLGEIAGRLGVSERHLHRLVGQAKMPKPTKLGRVSRYPKDEIDNWIGQGCPALGDLKRGSIQGQEQRRETVQALAIQDQVS